MHQPDDEFALDGTHYGLLVEDVFLLTSLDDVLLLQLLHGVTSRLVASHLHLGGGAVIQEWCNSIRCNSTKLLSVMAEAE